MQRTLFTQHPSPTPDTPQTPHHTPDILIIGAGFAGCYALHVLRQLNFSCLVLESGSDLGGVWHFNSYPGARVDSQWPVYALNIPAIYSKWRWSEHYPGHEEIKAYFRFVGEELGLYRDVEFGQTVVDVVWDEGEKRWNIRTEKGMCGLDTFEGEMHHSSFWPQEGVNVRGKKVGVVGTGATGVQIAQEWAMEIGDEGELKVFQRTPQLGFPMQQRKISDEEDEDMKGMLRETMERSRWTNAGFAFDSEKDLKTFDHGDEERERYYERLWEQGGFRFHAMNYSDILKDDRANDEAYNFWAKKVRARIRDPRKRDILAPLKKPHVIGGKRPSMEQWYYDIFDQPNVDVVDVKTNPIEDIVPKGIRTADGAVHELDIIALATGFDSVTGGLKDINIRGTEGLLRDKWDNGIWTHLGMTVSTFPNFFVIYGPQAPTAHANGPSAVEPQAEWIAAVLRDMREAGQERIEAIAEAEKIWKELVVHFSSLSLRHHVPSGWNGGNIPGKIQEPLSFAGGLPDYRNRIEEVRRSGMPGFVIS